MAATSIPLNNIISKADIVLAAGVMSMLLIMVVPLPLLVLDLLLALSITVGVLILFVALFTESSLEFSSFPSVLLIATIFRLSLNVASTRLILLEGHQGPGAAGSIINSFGEFVVGGNQIVGIIIFLILVIINFVVITKGTGRIAEVAARFTLDAMPGKQMAIDADLNAGLIDEDEARNRRSTIQRESDYFGALDGASKFVRGDAIAGLIITSINILGGLLVGVTQFEMTTGDAFDSYATLTIGDGLVSQIPALIISIAAGICIGLGYGDNTISALISRGLQEIIRLGVTLNANTNTFYGLSGLGDLSVTAFGKYSRNRQFGIKLGQGVSFKQANIDINMVIEGVNATKIVTEMSKKYKINMPIVDQVYSILFNNKNPKLAINELMDRKLKDEMI